MRSIRKATISDIHTIRTMANVAFRHTYREILTPQQMEYMMDWMYSEESLRRQMETQRHQFYVLSVEGEDVGYVSFNIEEKCETSVLFHLQKIYLLPQYQSQGLGTQLLKHAEVCMKEKAGDKAARYELNVNRNNRAVTFYEHMGLSKDREGDFPIGNGFYMNDYIMTKTLQTI